LNFEAQEEELWQHFKNCGDIDYVRIIRDAKTNLGKGFAYIQFKVKKEWKERRDILYRFFFLLYLYLFIFTLINIGMWICRVCLKT